MTTGTAAALSQFLDLGNIPDDWRVDTLSNLGGKTTSGSRGWAEFYSSHGDLFVRITNLRRSNIHLDLSSTRFVNLLANHPEADRTRVRVGDVLVSITADIGMIGYIDDDVPSPAYINQHIARVRFPVDRVASKFIAYYLSSWVPQKTFIGSTDTGAKAGMNLIAVGALKTVVPPLAEQRHIAHVLTDIDHQIALLERLISKKEAIKQGMMQQLLASETRLPGFGGVWHKCRLGDILTVRHGRNQRGVEIDGGKYPILASGGEIGRTDTPLYSKPSVLIGRKGTIDRPQFQATPFWTVDTLFYTEINEAADSKFVFYVFKTVDWRSMNEASGVPSLNTGLIESVPCLLPPVDEQRAIRLALDDADLETAVTRALLTKAKSIKQGMMQQLLTGRTRLPITEEEENP